MSKLFAMLRAMDAYQGAANDDDVICAGCGYAIPDNQLAARYGDVDVVPADALCDGCMTDAQDDPHDCPTDAQWR